LEEQKDVLEKMSEVRDIIELGLAERDKAGIKVRQILNKATIFSKDLKIKDNNPYLELIKEELNIKEIEVKEEGDLRVEIDTHISEELKREGIKRELIRFINLKRKDSGLSIEDLAKVEIKTNNSLVRESLDMFKEDIKKETLSSEITSIGLDDDEIDKKFKIDGEVVVIILN
jgi:isoleucyl-tRNA synthetase